ncbi:serine/threonine-protein kinase [Streptomyces sp. H39-S7]|uniref:serine/threonine-protein kinase n=1 Tax=Streptomyces sp. H39-S7 TaxID=3004357 RepID=UPI0022AF82D5|nr:serine/threonine-protein kinase [Streptomyces sp. H39-S7]MCZ4123852.1 serine/threonine-protein kinase [Streptomyces sp. H39-S7]
MADTSVPDPEVFQPLTDDDPKTVAGYLLSARLGAGGMGKVYLSYTPGGRPVAIKVIRPEFAEDPEFRRRFRQEVQAAQRVQGLYTAPVIDSDTDGPRPWLATAYVAGPSLHAAVADHGAMPVASVLLLVAGIAEALQVIHHAGIVHRDLKPSNVLLAVDGPRVIDFGIARAADTTALTGTGVSVGTPAFMSPEQAAGTSCTPATDIFALGQIAAFAAMGGAAFGNGPSHAVLYRIVHEEPDLSELPGELREIVTRCLIKDPTLRPSTAQIIAMCGQASKDPALRRPDGWLPQSYAADLTQAAAPAPQPNHPPAPPVVPQPGHPPTQAAPSTAPPLHPPTQPVNHQPVHPQQAHHQPGGQPQFPQQTQPVHPQAMHPQQPRPPVGGYAYPPTGGPGRPGGFLPLPPKKKKRTGLVIAGVVVALVVGSAVYTATHKGDDKKASSDQNTKTPSTSGGTTGNETGQSTAPADPKPVSYTGINIPGSYTLYLADEPPRPKKAEVGTHYEGDFGYSTDFIEGANVSTHNGKNTLALVQPGEPATLAGCRANTRYTETIKQDTISKGTKICVTTKAGHIGLVTIRSFGSSGSGTGYVSVDLTVWRNAVPAGE